MRGRGGAADGGAGGGLRGGNPDAATLQNLATLCSAHIGKEHAPLFPLSARLLPEDAQAALLAQFEQLEADAGGEHERLLAVVKALTRLSGLIPAVIDCLPRQEAFCMHVKRSAPRSLTSARNPPRTFAAGTT